MQRKRPPARAARQAPRQATPTGKLGKKSKRASPTPKLAESVTDGRRRELVIAAYQLIAERGLEELRTRDIAAKVGINISTLHYYFETKEDLIAAVVDHTADLFRTLRAPLPIGATALEELRHAFVTQAHRRRVEPWLDRVVPEMMLRAQRDEKVRARLEHMLQGWNYHIEALLARGMRDGDFAPDLDPRIGAAIVSSYLMGSDLQHGVRGGNFPEEAAYQRLVELLQASPRNRGKP
jgi:AcrR family transcriptional regulator